MEKKPTNSRVKRAPGSTRLDPVTSLYTQDHLMEELARALVACRQGNSRATLALLQLENFYEIRSWVGKSEADLLLVEIARLMESLLPDSAILCRCVHYEFALLMCNDSSVNSVSLTRSIRQRLLRAEFNSLPPQLELRCAIGLVDLDRDISSADVVLALARHRLRIHMHQPGSGSHETVSSEAALSMVREAIWQKQLQLSFQPLVSLRPDKLRRFEVRCRLAEPAALSPAILFETAVKNAQGENIDRWVIERVLKQSGQSSFTVSLTLNSLVSSNFFRNLHSQLQGYKLTPDRLRFQVSEIDILSAQHHMAYVCEQLRQLGIGLVITHFGCTSDPFRYLPLVSAQAVKLDVSLLEKIYDNPEIGENLARTVARLQSRGLMVIAGMVEDVALLPLLWDCGVELVQGNCIAPATSSLNYEFPRQRVLGAA